MKNLLFLILLFLPNPVSAELQAESIAELYHQGMLTAARFHPAAPYVVTVGGQSDPYWAGTGWGNIQVWELEHPEGAPDFRVSDFILRGCEFSRDGKMMVVTDMNNVCRVLEWPSLRLISSFSVAEGEMFRAVFSPDNKTILTYNYGVFEAHKVCNGVLVRRITHPQNQRHSIDTAYSEAPRLTFDPGYQNLFLAYRGALRSVLRFRGGIDVDANRGWVAAMDPPYPEQERYGFNIYDLRTGSLLHRGDGFDSWTSYLRFSPDGSKVLCGGRDGYGVLWDLETGRSLDLDAHSAEIVDLDFHPAQALCSTGSWDGQVKIWRYR